VTGTQVYETESASAILVTETGRLLMQLRDDGKPIAFPGHWGCFGGHVEAGEDLHQAIRRELLEEIGHAPAELRLFTSYVYQLAPRGRIFWERESIFVGRIAEVQVPNLSLMEGEALQLWRLDDLLRQPRVVPHHAAALMLFERLGTPFGFPPRQA
jgi:8-oxo-dGTP diphosphatase